MTYDFHWSGGSPGPIAPKWWVNDVASYASSVIASRKISMGMPAYGRDWFGKKLSGHLPGEGARDGVPHDAADAVVRRSIGVTPKWKERGTSQRFTYVRKYSGGGDTCRVKRVVWFDDARSLETKAPLVDKYGLRGIAIWALGNRGLSSLAAPEAVRSGAGRARAARPDSLRAARTTEGRRSQP